MESFKYTIKDESGIHVRPAGLLAKEGKKFTSKITIIKDNKQSDITKMMAVMAIGIKCGDTITINVVGDDEAEATKTIKTFLENNL